MANPLIDRARADYGDLILAIYEFDHDLGIDVHLIGGCTVQYFPSGLRHHVEQPSTADRIIRLISATKGKLRCFLCR